MPSLSSGGAAADALGVHGQDEGGDALVASGAVGHREQHADVGDRAVGDPVLGAVDHPLVAVAGGGGALRRRVGAGLGLGEARSSRASCPRASGVSQRLLLLVGAELVDRIADQRVVDAHDHAGRRAGAADLLHREHVADVVDAGAAVLLGDRHAEEAELGHARHQLRRDGDARDRSRRPSAGPRSCAKSRAVFWTSDLLFGQRELHGCEFPASGERRVAQRP